MRSRLWNREDIRHILWSNYAAQYPFWREPGAQVDEKQEEKERFFIKGYRAAMLTLLMALGLPLEPPVSFTWEAEPLPPAIALLPPSPSSTAQAKKTSRPTAQETPPSAGKDAPRSGRNPRTQWWVEDLENTIAAIYHSAMLTPAAQAHTKRSEAYFAGFKAVISGLLRALGSQKNLDQWLKQEQLRVWEEEKETTSDSETGPSEEKPSG